MRAKVRTAKKLSTKRKKQLSAKIENKQGSEEFEMANEFMQKFNPKVWESAIATKRQMSAFDPRGYEPDERTLENLIHSKNIGIFIGQSNEHVTLERTKNPSPHGSFGFIGIFANVLSNSTFIPGILILRFDQNKLGSVARETLRLFRWDENSQSFTKIFYSDVGNGEHDYVWGRITQPGIYGLIGLNSHPLVIRTAKVFSILSDVASGLNPENQKQMQEKICKIILQSSELRKAIERPDALNTLMLASAMQGFPDPLNAWKKNPGGFEEPDPDNICPDLMRWPRPDKPTSVSRPLILPEIHLLDTWRTSMLALADPAWRSVGPVDLSGKIMQVVIDPVNNNRLYAVSANGGLWRLNDVSKYPTFSWVPLTDQNETLATTSVAIAPSDNKVIYLANILGHLLRSPDGGSTWNRMGTTNLGFVRKIIVHPSYEELIFVASSTGLWRSLNGGDTWDSGIVGRTDLPLVVGDVTDAVMDPDIPSILYIGFRGSGLWKSYGIIDPTVRAWELMLPWSAAHSPKGSMIKIAVGRKGSDATRTVAVKFDQEVFINHRGGRPSSKPGGEDWKSMGEIKGDGQVAGNGQGDSNHTIAIDPFHDSVRYLDSDTLDETNILAGAQSLFHSTDGGKSWNHVGGYGGPGGTWMHGVHPDQNSIMFDPKMENRVYVCNDGGVYKSDDGGNTWEALNKNLVTSQFYDVGVSGDTALCGMYHSGIVGSTSLNKKLWEAHGDGLGGGQPWEWSDIFGDPVRSGTFYVHANTLWRHRYPRPTTTRLQEIGSFLPTPGYPALAVDPRSSSNILLVGTQNPGTIMRTKNVHETSPKWNPEPGINLVDDAIVSIDFAPSTPGMAYAVSVSGRIFRKVNVSSEEKWEEMGQWVVAAGVRQIAVNALHDNHIYLITRDDKHATENRIAFSQDGGKTWAEISGTGKNSLPHCSYYSLLAHRYDGRTILLGVDAGVFISDDEGQNWYTYDTNLPNAQILDIFWSENYLYASAHGRGLWRREVPYSIPYLILSLEK